MNFTRIRVRIHLLTLSCMYARTLAYSHVRTPTPIPYTMDGKFFGPFHVKYTYTTHMQLPLAAIQSKYVL